MTEGIEAYIYIVCINNPSISATKVVCPLPFLQVVASMATLKAVLGRWLADPSVLDIRSWPNSSSSNNSGVRPTELEAYVPPPPPFQPRWHMPDKIMTPKRPDLGLPGSDRPMRTFSSTRRGSSPHVNFESPAQNLGVSPNRCHSIAHLFHSPAFERPSDMHACMYSSLHVCISLACFCECRRIL